LIEADDSDLWIFGVSVGFYAGFSISLAAYVLTL